MLGTPKLPATHTSIYRRWKSNSCIVDTYIENSNLYPDVKVVQCVRSAVKYMMREDRRVSLAFILTHICANTASIFPREATLVLGIALLWVYCNHETCQLFPQPYIEKIKAKCGSITRYLTIKWKSCEKLQISVSDQGGVFVITNHEKLIWVRLKAKMVGVTDKLKQQ